MLLGATTAGGSTLLINTTSDNLDWDDDLIGNTVQGAFAGVGVASFGGSVNLLRTGATSGQRLLGATEVTAEVTGALAFGVADPVLRPVIGQQNLDGFRTATGAVAAVTGIGAFAGNTRNVTEWISTRRAVDEVLPPGSNQQPLFDANIARPGQQVLFDPVPFNVGTTLDLAPTATQQIPGQLSLLDDAPIQSPVWDDIASIASPLPDVGLANRGLRPAPGTRIAPDGIPEGWRIEPTRGAGGTLYVDPSNRGNAVRVMQGNPNSPFPNSQVPYVRWQRNGQPLDVHGNVLSTKKSPDAHIPLKDFTFDPVRFST